jgi:hypothetical protein
MENKKKNVVLFLAQKIFFFCICFSLNKNLYERQLIIKYSFSFKKKNQKTFSFLFPFYVFSDCLKQQNKNTNNEGKSFSTTNNKLFDEKEKCVSKLKKKK